MLNDYRCTCPVYLACGYTDLRQGIDGLAGIVQQRFHLDPFQNMLFLFCGRRKDRIKGLYWGRGRFFAGVQAAGGREFSVATEWNRGKADHGAAIPVAHGGAERGAAQGEPPGNRAAAGIKREGA